MKLKKLLLMTLAMFSLSSPIANAEIVTVNGSGASETAAINDAKRNAVEQVVGTAVKAHTVAVDLQLVFDAIDARTLGYVNSCEVISKSSSGGVVNVTANVDVSADPNSSLMKDVDVVINLNDPRISVGVGIYDDDTSKRHAERCAAAIRSELIKHKFNHVVEKSAGSDYIVTGTLFVDKPAPITLPNSSKPTGLVRFNAVMDGRIKRSDTEEIIEEFHATGESIGIDNGNADNPAVTEVANIAAQKVRDIFNQAARNIFSSVKVFIYCHDNDKFQQVEEYLRQSPSVTGVHVRSLDSGKCTIDVDTYLVPQELYEVLAKVVGNDLKMYMQSYSSTTLEIFLYEVPK